MPQLNNQPHRETALWSRSEYPASGIMSQNKPPTPQEDPALQGDPALRRYPVPQEYESLTVDPAPQGAPLSPASGAAPGAAPVRRRGISKCGIPMEHRERYPGGRIKEIRPRPAQSPDRLALMRAGERVRSGKYKAKKRIHEIAIGYRNADGTFTEEAKKLEKERRIVRTGAKLKKKERSAATSTGRAVPEEGAEMGPQVTVAKGEGTSEGFEAQDISAANTETSFDTISGGLMALAAIMTEI